MRTHLAQEATERRSYIDVELSEHCSNAPELYLPAMLDAISSGVAVLDESGTILYANRAWRQLAARRGLAHDLCGVGLSYLEVCRQISGARPEEVAAVTEGITQILLRREFEFQKEYSCHAAHARWRGLIHATRFDLPNAFRVLVTHDEVAPDKQAEDDETLRLRAEETLVNLSGRLINAQEEERKRIARELHDDLNQRMALLSIELAQVGERIQKPRQLRPLIHSLQTKAQEISAEIHRLSYRLHPSKLDHLGLAAAVESLCGELSGSGKIRVEFHQKGFPAVVTNDISLCVFRIAQESLRNCLKHSGARQARVVLEKTEGAVLLSVTDDGRGFDSRSDEMTRGLGFTSMRERLHLVGGEMRIRSQPLSGTRIEISVPLAEGR
ncbi:MAG TPA: ATP-binding protein [Pyrinomonadaceae bacterium]|jgi:signal transduction histidine kinase